MCSFRFGTHAEGAPTVYQSIVCECETRTIERDDLDKISGDIAKRRPRYSGGYALLGVQVAFVIRIPFIGPFVNITCRRLPCRVPPERSVIIDAPCQDLLVKRECYTVHAPGSDLDDSDGGGGEEGVNAGSFYAGGFLPVDRARAQAELAGLTVAADVDVEFCCWGSVKRC